MMLFLLYNNSGDIMDILSIIEKNKNKEDNAIIKEYDECKKIAYENKAVLCISGSGSGMLVISTEDVKDKFNLDKIEVEVAKGILVSRQQD